MRVVLAIAFLMLAASALAAETVPRTVDLPEADLSELKLDAQGARRFEELRDEIRRRQRVTAAVDMARSKRVPSLARRSRCVELGGCSG